MKMQGEDKRSKWLILKELPNPLKYVFLRIERFKPMIIVADLTSEKE